MGSMLAGIQWELKQRPISLGECWYELLNEIVAKYSLSKAVYF